MRIIGLPFSIYSEGAQLGSDDLGGSGSGGGGGGGKSTGCLVFLFPSLTRKISSGLKEGACCCLGGGAAFGAGVAFLTMKRNSNNSVEIKNGFCTTCK